MSRIKTWSQIVDEVQNSSIQPYKQKLDEDMKRKQIYKNILIDQIKQKNTKTRTQKINQRQKQLQNVHKILVNQQELTLKSRLQQRQKQSLYQIQNKNIAQQRDKNIQSLRLIQKKQFQQHPQNPFVSLVDKQRKRKQQFRAHEQERYYQNHNLQMQKNAIRQAAKRQEFQKEKEQQKYIQSTIKKRQKDRQNYIQKYLKTEGIQSRRHNRNYSHIDSNGNHLYLQNDSLDRQYANYNINIMKTKKNKQCDTVDFNSQKINHSLNKLTVSPAYLGKIPENNDRRRQMMILNRNLGIKTNPNEHEVDRLSQLQTKQKIQKNHIRHENINITPILYKTRDQSAKCLTQKQIKFQNPEKGIRQNPSYLRKFPRYNILTHSRQKN